jgi:hypothetical protein
MKRLWDRRSRAARIGTMVGLVVLFALVAIGVYVGTGMAIVTRGPHSATGAPNPSTAPGSHLGSSPSVQWSVTPESSIPGPSASGPKGSAQPVGAVVGQPPPPGDPTAGVPGAPGGMALHLVDKYGDLAVTASWTAAIPNGHAVTSYLASLYIGSSPPVGIEVSASPAVLHFTCSGSCPIDGRVTVQAINAIGFGPAGTATFHDVLPHVTGFQCFPNPVLAGNMVCVLTTPDTNVTITWVKNMSPQPQLDGQTTVTADDPNCPSVPITMTATVGNAAGLVVRSGAATCSV